MMGKLVYAFGIAVAAVSLAAANMACPPNDGNQPPTEEQTRVLTAFTADSGSTAKLVKDILALQKADVALEDIESLTVTLTGITLDYAGPQAPAGDPEDVDGEQVVLLTNDVDVNLMDLTDVSLLLTEATVPAGYYTKVRLNIENPRLVLVDDPETVISSDIQLTANGRVFISRQFELPAEQQNLIIVDFGGIKLVQLGNGGFVLTPQLDAEINVSDAAIVVEGEIIAVDETLGIVTVQYGGGAIDVVYGAAAIWLPGDVDGATGVVADLSVGSTVMVEGFVTVGGAVDADHITILAIATV